MKEKIIRSKGEAIFVFSISAGLHGKEGIVGLVVVLVQVVRVLRADERNFQFLERAINFSRTAPAPSIFV